MNKVILIIFSALIVIFLLSWAFNIFTATSPAGKIEGIVVSKTNTTITIRTSNGIEKEIPITAFNVGDDVNITIYKSKYTDKVEYHFVKVKLLVVAGE